MTRAEIRRRKKENEKMGKQIILTRAEINRMNAEATERAYKVMFGVTLIVLRDKYGFGRKRLKAFQDEMLKQIKCVEEGYVTFSELKEIVEKETGLEIIRTKGEIVVNRRDKI